MNSRRVFSAWTIWQRVSEMARLSRASGSVWRRRGTRDVMALDRASSRLAAPERCTIQRYNAYGTVTFWHFGNRYTGPLDPSTTPFRSLETPPKAQDQSPRSARPVPAVTPGVTVDQCDRANCGHFCRPRLEAPNDRPRPSLHRVMLLCSFRSAPRSPRAKHALPRPVLRSFRH
jgi:hypothetical protein